MKGVIFVFRHMFAIRFTRNRAYHYDSAMFYVTSCDGVTELRLRYKRYVGIDKMRGCSNRSLVKFTS